MTAQHRLPNSLMMSLLVSLATDPMCGQWMLQALDEDSCLTTAARPIPDLVVP